MAYTVPKLDDFSAANLDKAVRELLDAVRQEAAAVNGENDWKNFRDRWMARKNGILSQVNDLWLKAAPSPSKRDVGARVNQLKAEVEQIVDAAQQRASGQTSKAHLESERLDITLPGIHKALGAEHPMLRTMNEVVSVFRNMGYSVAEGPEIETDYYNFEALNFPPNHPARDTQDTLFVAGQEKKPQRDRLLLRTHTSPVQIRSMLKQPPPLRVVIPGKVHRADTADATHSPIFHQVEGLAVDTNITFCDLKGTLDHAMKALFGSNVKTRFFPSFFPFTEPSADVSITCFKCAGKGCRLCKMSGWIELLGCGMVDPNVFKFVEHNGYNPDKISGFAFGMGVERITMLKYGIDDIQLFYQGDVRFLEQFA
ncbi:MAG TPA: phenylalanine--tRNA ligase subunit alpha [Candidatus Acidoferrales bacterium]|nr:phenylalanine--tRNA ligase subunit alpha [Candidatus Acidoferrales bacterium]